MLADYPVVRYSFPLLFMYYCTIWRSIYAFRGYFSAQLQGGSLTVPDVLVGFFFLAISTFYTVFDTHKLFSSLVPV
jgi:hypothetical protein